MTFPQKCLASLGTVHTGSTPSTSDEQFWGGKIPFVTPSELDQRLPVFKTPRTLTAEGGRQSRLIREGSIMVCCIGSLGKIGIAGQTLATNQQINSIEFDPQQVWPKFGYYACQTLKPKLVTMAPATTIAIVSKSKFSQLEIPVPPLPEQRRIANILDQADALRAKRREALAQLDSLTQSIFIEMFGDPATNPMAWPVKTVEQICEVKGGKRLPKGADYSATPTPFRYVRVTDMKSGKVDESNLHYLTPEVQRTIARYIVNTGDVIISIAGSIGVIAEVQKSLNGANLTENAAKLVSRTKADYVPKFLASMLGMRAVQSQIESHVGQVTIGKLALFRIEKLLIPLPPLSLQQSFASRIQIVEGLTATHRAALVELDNLFASLQHRAFQGGL